MLFIAILKTAGDLEKRPKHLKDLPAEYPLETTNAFEAKDFKEAHMLYPTATIVTFDEYKKYKEETNHYNTKPLPKPKWKFW